MLDAPRSLGQGTLIDGALCLASSLRFCKRTLRLWVELAVEHKVLTAPWDIGFLPRFQGMLAAAAPETHPISSSIQPRKLQVVLGYFALFSVGSAAEFPQSRSLWNGEASSVGSP